ncbi:MAG: FAD-dependent oxidoreductase [Candidatus Woesearchaeota archaeon]
MKILVVGAGFAGCTAAHLLDRLGHEVTLIEKSDHLGGLSTSRQYEDGRYYEPYGAHIFHTKNKKIWDFVSEFSKFNSYKHQKGMIIDGTLFHFPLCKDEIGLFPDKDVILKELEFRPKTVDQTNFETAMISLFGRTLYSKFIKNYSEKMWGPDFRSLPVSVGLDRIPIKTKKEVLFEDKYQGVPVKGYQNLFRKMLSSIRLRLSTSEFSKDDYDLVLYSGPIDELFHNCKGKLAYKGLEFVTRTEDRWECLSYGTINLPDNPIYIRKSNFDTIYERKRDSNFLVQYQKSGLKRMYPFQSKEYESTFQEYLRLVADTNIIPIGRLGLFRYLNMDEAVWISMEVVSRLDEYISLDQDGRVKLLNILRL